jgi:protein-S-isoprenylcysteine O-methyltransferase Ste14
VSDLLDALAIHGRRARLLVGAAIWVFFGCSMVGLAAVQAVVERSLGVGPSGTVVVVMLVWAAWTYWHSVLFARHRQRHLAQWRYPYRAAFVIDLVPGLSISFSQMIRPAWNGSNLRTGDVFPTMPHGALETAAVATGWLLLFAAALLFAWAWRALGAARVGFAAEYVQPERFTPIRSGPYARVRHPLFWSGIGVSAALPLICLSSAGAAVALVNFGYGLFYNRLEDRRLKGVFGARYAVYAGEVPRIIPSARP